MKDNNVKSYEVEFESTTYRRYYIDAKNEMEAEAIASKELDSDLQTSQEWKQNSRITYIEELD